MISSRSVCVHPGDETARHYLVIHADVGHLTDSATVKGDIAMKRRMGFATVLAAVVVMSACVAPVAADWPMYRHDASRNATGTEQLATPLHLQWTCVPTAPPRPAWPEPGRELHRIDFDYAFQVAIADGLAYFGSSATHKVHAIELATGRERWSFFTEGPVRFAPAVEGERVFVASDDGWLYCLSASEGKLLWRFYGGPRPEKLIGNKQMISRWPLRSGVAVADGTVYFTAGMWPAEGIYIYALGAEDGALIWCNDTSGQTYMPQPHPGASAITGVAPQGYVVVDGDRVFVPTGRNVPALYDRSTGRLLHYYGGPASWGIRWGGCRVSAFGDMLFGRFNHVGADLNVMLGESDPWPGDGLIAYDAQTGDMKRTLPGKHCAVASEDTLYASGSGKVTAFDIDALLAGSKPKECTKWETPHERAYELILTGDTLMVGGRGTVTAIDADSGKQLWQATVDGQVRGLAAADGRLLASMNTGAIACFGPDKVSTPVTIEPQIDATPYPDTELNAKVAQLALRIINETGISAGHCLNPDARDGLLAYHLARQSDLQICCLDPHARQVDVARRALDAAGLYGTRVSAHRVIPATELPYADYFADLIVLGDGRGATLGNYSARELYRVLRPTGGVAYLAGDRNTDSPSAQEIKKWLRDGGIPSREIRTSGDAVVVMRGKLPGAGEWTHQYSDAGKSGCSNDLLVKLPLEMLWFGPPGPAQMISRHWRAPSPVAINGRMFVGGQHTIIAVDAYNGRELWTWDLPNIGRTRANLRGGNLAADRDSIYVATGGVCFGLDAATGQALQTYRLPLRSERYSLAEAQTFELDGGENRSGTITLEATEVGLQVTLATVDDKVTNPARADSPSAGDCWELFFDFRPVEQATVRYDTGAFSVIIVPATVEQDSASWHTASGPAHPRITVRGALSETGSETTAQIPWREMRKLAGARPAEFAFGATLNSSDDGKKITKRTHKFANGDSYRLTSALARFIVDEKAQGEEQPDSEKLFRADLAEVYKWMYLSHTDDRVFGTIGTIVASSHVFALDKHDGASHWIYTAEEDVSNNAVTVGTDKVFLIDRTSDYKIKQMKRRGEKIEQRYTLLAIDAATGKTVWSSHQRMAKLHSLFFHDGVLVATGEGKMAAFRDEDGKMLWSRTAKMRRFPVIVNDTIYGEPYAYDLTTGERKQAEHPLTGEQVQWRFGRAYGCGSISATPSMLIFRSGTLGFCDLAGDTGIHNVGGIRAGCYINAIAANGLILMPPADSACTCSYNYQTTIAMVPAGKDDEWSLCTAAGLRPGTRVTRLALNLGAPGDRTAGGGNVWLAFPRPGTRAALSVAVATEISPDAPGYYRHDTGRLFIAGTDAPWLYASGCCGLRSAAVELIAGSQDDAPPTEPKSYTVRLHFAELENLGPGQRVFDVKLQDKVVFEGLDIAEEAGGRNKALVKLATGIAAADTLKVELVPRVGEPIISAIEAWQE